MRLMPYRWKGIGSVFRGTEVAARTAVLAGGGLVVLAGMGRLDLAAYTMFGAFCAAYGGNERYLTRARTVAVAGMMNLGAIAVGVAMSFAQVSPMSRFVVFAAAMAISVVCAHRYELIPAQPFFPAISLLVCAAIPVAGWQDAVVRVAIAAAATLFSWGLSMAGWVPRRFVRRPPGLTERRQSNAVHAALLKDLQGVTSVRPLGPRRQEMIVVIGLIIVAGFISDLIVASFGLDRAYWALVTVASVMPMVGGAVSIRKAVERIFGTAVGVLVLVYAPSLPLPAVVGIGIIVIAQFITQLLVASHYGEALVFITILVFVSLSYSMPLYDRDLHARLADTAIGSLVSIVLLMLAVRFVSTLRNAGTAAGNSGGASA